MCTTRRYANTLKLNKHTTHLPLEQVENRKLNVKTGNGNEIKNWLGVFTVWLN